MASFRQYQFSKHRGQVRFDSSNCRLRKGSKCQMCLHNILHIISTVKQPNSGPETAESELQNDSGNEKKCSEIDLDVEFVDSQEVEEARESTVGGEGPSSSGKTVENGGSPSAYGKGGGLEFNIGSRFASRRDQYDQQESDAKRKLNLLIDAAKLVFGEFEESAKSESESISKSAKPNEFKNNEPTVKELNAGTLAAGIGGDFDETASPMVRSKRGRTRFLPHKYRDSVLEPLSQLSSHRSSVISRRRGQTRK